MQDFSRRHSNILIITSPTHSQVHYLRFICCDLKQRILPLLFNVTFRVKLHRAQLLLQVAWLITGTKILNSQLIACRINGVLLWRRLWLPLFITLISTLTHLTIIFSMFYLIFYCFEGNLLFWLNLDWLSFCFVTELKVRLFRWLFIARRRLRYNFESGWIDFSKYF